jgi:hypothetical protein
VSIRGPIQFVPRRERKSHEWDLDCPLVLRQRRIRHFSLRGRSVMEKKSERVYRQFPVGFQKDALERMKHCDDIRALAAELGVSRGALYLWKRKAEGLPAYGKGSVAAGSEESARKIQQLEAQVASLEGELGRRSLEASFFKSALRKVEGVRRQSEKPGEIPSTTRSAAGRRRAK